MAQLQQQIQNPLADLISLPFQNNIFSGIGPNERTRNQLNIQPVVPIHLGRVNLITRVILPVENIPYVNRERGHVFGLGDTLGAYFFSPAKPGRIIWGVGPTGFLPTRTQPELGAGRFSLGPGFTILTQQGNWTVGFFLSNSWSLRDVPGKPNVNFLFGQYYLTRNLRDGWFVTTNPIFTVNWTQTKGNRATLPLAGGGVGRLFRVGGQPMSALVSYFYHVVRPQDIPAPRQELRLQINILLPRRM